MLSTICYVSSANKNHEGFNLENLFLTTKANNLKNSITGVLIYQGGNFLQILEGDKTLVNKLFKRIKNDFRHTNTLQLLNTNISSSIFEDYKTGFETIDSRQEIKGLENYLNWLKTAELESVDKTIAVIENFITRKI